MNKRKSFLARYVEVLIFVTLVLAWVVLCVWSIVLAATVSPWWAIGFPIVVSAGITWLTNVW